MGGILFSMFGLTPILYVSIGCFLASAAMEFFIHIPYKKGTSKGNIIATGFTDLKESFRFLFRERPVLWKTSFVYASVGLFLTALVLVGVPVLITQHLNFPPDTANRLYGYAQGVIAAGAIAGGLLAGIFSKRLTAKASPFLLAGCALSVLLGGVALHTLSGPMGTYILLLVGCGLLTAISTIFQIQMMSYIQLLAPKNLIGKIISCVMCVCMCTIPLGQFIYGIVFDTIGSLTYLPFYAAAFIVIGICISTRRIFYSMDSQRNDRSKEQEILLASANPGLQQEKL